MAHDKTKQSAHVMWQAKRQEEKEKTARELPRNISKEEMQINV